MAEAEATAADRNVEIWKIKKLIKSLEAARGYVYYDMYFMTFNQMCGYSIAVLDDAVKVYTRSEATWSSTIDIEYINI